MHNFSLKIKNLFISLIIGLVFVFSFSQFFTKSAEAGIGINRQINFQGKLVNNPSSTNVTNTSYTIIFTLYDNASGGTQLWQETQSVTTTDGIFRVALGSVTAFPANFNFNWSGLYLGIKVNSDSEMTPRVQMAAVPFAFNAEKVAGLTVQDTSGNASTSGTLQIANAKTISFSDNIAFGTGTTGTISLGSSTNTLTLTTSGNTTLALPTSGTLCTTASCLASDPYWNQSSGTLFPNNSTVDFLIGGQATTSAKFAVLGIAAGTNPSASVSATSGANSGNGIAISGDGSIQSFRNNGLTLGGATTGNISISPLNGGAGSLLTVNAVTTTLNNTTTLNAASLATIDAAASLSLDSTTFTLGNGSAATIQTTTNGLTLNSGSNTLTFDSSDTTLTASGLATFTSAATLAFSGDITITGNDITNTTLNLGGGAAATIGTVSDDNLTVTPQGTGDLILSSDFDSTVLIGSSANTPAVLSISGGIANNAALIVNNLNNGDLIAASASGVTKFRLDTSGNASMSGSLTMVGANSIQTTSNTALTIGGATTGNITLSPNNGTAGLVSISGSSLFTTGTGLTTLGGSLTISGTAITLASATTIDSSGAINLGTTNATTLTLGRSTQGITLPGFLTCTLKTDGSGVLQCGTDLQGSGGGAFTELAGAIVPLNSTEDFLIGGQATTSAKFAVLGVNTGQTIASVSGNLIVMPQNGWGGQLGIGTTNPISQLQVNANTLYSNNETSRHGFMITSGDTLSANTELYMGADDTNTLSYIQSVGDNGYRNLILQGRGGNVSIGTITNSNKLDVNGGASFGTYAGTVAPTNGVIISGNVGIGTTAPTAPLHVNSGYGSNAALIVNQLNSGDILAASASGATKFTIANNGDVVFTGAVTGVTTLAASGAIAANGGITFDADTDTLGAFTMGGNIIGGSFIITDIGSTGTDFDTSGGLSITTDAAGTALTVDNAANASSIFVAEDNNTPVFTIADGGDITWAAASPTITINAAETFTISNGTAADNFVYNTSTNALTIGDGTNGLTFDIDTGITYQGSGRSTQRITLTPEYAGGAIMADGVSNTGAMTSDNTNAAGTKFRNFYKWTNTQGTAQDYDIWISVPIPNDFSAMAATPTLSIDTYTSDLTNGTVLVTVYDSQATPIADCTDVAFTPTGTINTWESKTATTCLDTGTYTAGGVMTIKIHLTAAATTGDTRVSTIFFNYLSAF